MALNNKGVALVIVLWAVAFLMVMATEFSLAARTGAKAARNYTHETQAYYLALAGVNMGIAEISSGYKLVALDGGGRVVFIGGGIGFEGKNTVREFMLGKGRVAYSVEDESSKVNLNTAARETIDSLFQSAGMEKTERDVIVDSILDWRDQNSEFHLNGAEDDYYLALPSPYESKDGPIDEIEELLMVKGMAPAVFYGTGDLPFEFGRAVDPQDAPHPGIRHNFTVFGNGKININTASAAVLEAALGKGKAQEVLLRRGTEGFFETPAYNGAVSSDIFTVYSVGEAEGIKVAVKAVVEKRAGGRVKALTWNEGVLARH